MVDGVARDRPRQGVLEAGRDAEWPVAARGLVSGRAPRTQSRGRDGARKATEASSRTPSEGPGAVPAAGEVDRAGMYAEAPESRSAAGRRRLWKMFFMTGNRLMCYASKGDQDSRFIGNLCGSQAWVKAKAIDYLQDRQKNPIIQNLSTHRLGRRPRKASALLAVPRYRHEEDRYLR